MDPSRISVLPVAPTGDLVPTTDEDYPRFRILIVGRSGAGKSSLINTIFKASLADVAHNKAGAADISHGITSPDNKHLIIHESGFYGPGEEGKFRNIEKFITEQTQKQSPAERLHAIWLCIPASYSGGRLFETGEEKIFKLNRNKVPIIVVITKFDLYVAGLQRRAMKKKKISYQSAEDDFNKKYGPQFGKNSITKGLIPHVLVSKMRFDTCQRLFQITGESIRTETPGVSSGHGRGSDEDRSGPAQIALATAQRVDMAGKVDASIKVGKKKYWTAIGSGIFWNKSLENCLKAIHKDIITIWNIRDLHDYLLGDAFHRRMTVIVEDLQDAANTTQSKETVASAMAGPAKLWTNSVFKEGPENMRCLMGYIVDLTLILQAIFQVSLQDRYDGRVVQDNIDEIIYEFHCSEKKKNIHDAIRKSIETGYIFARENVVNEIASLIQKYEMTLNDTKLDRQRPAIRSLLPILRFELTANGLVVNQTILGLVRELLVFQNFRGIVVDLDPLDVELLLDFILYLLQNNSLVTSGIPNANRKARQLMFKLISEADVIPRSLYITDVSTDFSRISAGGYGRVLGGKYQQKLVVLKVIDKGHKDVNQEFCQEALAWRSLSHPFILPLLGIFRGDKLQMFLVSPYMENGTLSSWREKNEPPVLSEIHRLMIEAAQGVHYMHSEGIVHGDLKGDNILLDSDLHCRIADFGLARHSAATATGIVAFSIHFAAPELFAKCNECGQASCDGTLPGHEVQRKKTMETDVYAFGCLYYSIFFNTIPFGKNSTFYQVSWHIVNEKRPPRLESPKMADKDWNLIQDCWKKAPSERPKMEQIVSIMASFTSLSSPIRASLSESLSSLLSMLRVLAVPGSSMINNDTLRIIGQLLRLHESDSIASSLKITSDIELLLDFVLDLLHNGLLSSLGAQDVSRKARSLMFRLIDKTHVMPKSLFITDIPFKLHLDPVVIAQIGSVFRGDHKGKHVVLKLVYKGHENDLLRNNLFREALTWQSLSHRFVLPMSGIFKEQSQLLLVSPFMLNGTLAQWRKDWTPAVAEIHRLMLEVAEGIQYIHSEGIVHGDLRAENVLLDSEFHCQISDIGLTWHSDATTLSVLNFVAPELFVVCDKCYRFDCDGCDGNSEVKGRRTMQTDVYAFGCLHYAIFFGSVPFREKQQLQIPQLVARGARPARLTHPVMDDGVWNLIQDCWKYNPAERPTMKQMVEKYVAFLATLPSLLETLRQLPTRDSTIVNDHTYRLICGLLEQYDFDTIASEVGTTSDVELFLDFVLYLLHNGHLSDDASGKARRLMFKLIEIRGVVPKSLFITGIATKTEIEAISTACIGHSILRGEHEGKQVVLQTVLKVHDDDTKEFYREALEWLSLAHDFVLPLLGIFEDNSHLFLVSPLMTNGTVTEWRKNHEPGVKEIQKLMLEVAKGIQYIHAEGIIHGDIRGENILLNSSFHCQITNIGLTRRSDVIVSSMINFAAPELFNTINDRDGYEVYNIQPGRKTVRTDVYAFGCLCYAIFFDVVPFQDTSQLQVPRLVRNGERAARLNSLPMEDGIWNVIQHCWMSDPSKRPTMKNIVRAGMTFTSFQFLLTPLSMLRTLGKSMVNEDTVRLICELLNLPGSYVTATELKGESDIELLLEFVVDLLRSDGLANVGLQGANRRARQLMFKLISKTNVVPKSFFITNVTELEAIGIGGFGRVSKGLHKGRAVAVKELYKGFHKNSLPTDFCREALVWRSLSHRFIVPLLGIYERNSQLSFVSPFMPNGTLTQWRKDHKGDASEIYRLMLEVGEGVYYLHSEGVIHGDLHGANVLLDAELHCQIIDFGLTRHAEATVTKTTKTFVPNFAAPELFGGMCITCGQQDCDGCSSSNDVQHTGKTEKTDVYAFGCLYYAIFFDTAPFNGNSELQIMRLVTTGGRPDRLENPKMEDETWDLVQSCWNYKPSERPTMEEIVTTLTQPTKEQDHDMHL